MLHLSPSRDGSFAIPIAPPLRHRAQTLRFNLVERACRLHRALQHRLSMPRRAAQFAGLNDRTLADIGLHRSQVLSAIQYGPDGIPSNDDHAVPL